MGGGDCAAVVVVVRLLWAPVTAEGNTDRAHLSAAAPEDTHPRPPSPRPSVNPHHHHPHRSHSRNPPRPHQTGPYPHHTPPPSIASAPPPPPRRSRRRGSSAGRQLERALSGVSVAALMAMVLALGEWEGAARRRGGRSGSEGRRRRRRARLWALWWRGAVEMVERVVVVSVSRCGGVAGVAVRCGGCE